MCVCVGGRANEWLVEWRKPFTDSAPETRNSAGVVNRNCHFTGQELYSHCGIKLLGHGSTAAYNHADNRAQKIGRFHLQRDERKQEGTM